MMRNDQFTSLEQTVLGKILNDDHPILSAFKTQLTGALVKSRTFSGIGFYTDFELAPNQHPVVGAPSRFRFGDVVAEVEGLDHGAGFVLFADDGVLLNLEGYTFAGDWPTKTKLLSLRYEPYPRDFTSFVTDPY